MHSLLLFCNIFSQRDKIAVSMFKMLLVGDCYFPCFLAGFFDAHFHRI